MQIMPLDQPSQREGAVNFSPPEDFQYTLRTTQINCCVNCVLHGGSNKILVSCNYNIQLSKQAGVAAKRKQFIRAVARTNLFRKYY